MSCYQHDMADKKLVIILSLNMLLVIQGELFVLSCHKLEKLKRKK